MTCNRNCDCVGECKAGNEKPTIPTPGDLSARLLAESQRRESEWAHIPTNNPRSKFVHDERLRELLREAAAALSALPAAGGEQSELRALAHDMGAFLNANRASLPSKVIQDSYALHNRLNALAWATTPQPSAAEDYESWAKQERQREDTATRLGSAAVGAQGDGYDAHEYMEERVAKDLKWFREERASRLAAPAAGKGVDAFELVRGRLPAPIRTNHAAWPPNYAEGFNDAIRIVEEELPEALDALTRQPVAGESNCVACGASSCRGISFCEPVAGDGDADLELWQDGEFVAGSSGPRAEAWREILHYAAQYEQDGAVTIMEVIRRPLAAPAATPTDGGEGKS